MPSTVRRSIYALCTLAVIGSIIAWLSTGGYWYTRFKDPEIQSAESRSGLSDVFAETGQEDAPLEQIENVNAIGLLPSGPGRATLSVAAISGPAILVAAGAWWVGRRGAKAMPPDEAASSHAGEQA